MINMEVLVLGNRENIFNDVVDEAILPCGDGEVSIWDFHLPCLLMLKEGKVTLKSKKLKEDFFIQDGLARFEGNRLAVICNIKG